MNEVPPFRDPTPDPDRVRQVVVPTDLVERDLRIRTASEELYLWRFRQTSQRVRRTMGRSGSAPSQDEAATLLGVTAAVYHDAETGKIASRDVRTILALTGDAIVVPDVGELCFLARRRAGLTLTQAAHLMGVSHVTYLEREKTGAAREMWEGRGFIF